MVFSSFVFLLGFLPITLLIYYALPKYIKNAFILLASLIFYAWGEPVYIIVMIGSIFINFFAGLLIDFLQKKEKRPVAKIVLICSIITNVGILSFFKYAGIIIGVIGVSFYTFQCMSYVIDVYEKRCESNKNIINFAAYVSMFPQLIAGPIVRYKDIEKELKRREIKYSDIAKGIYIFCIGLAKKVILANQVGIIFDEIKSMTNISVAGAWVGAISYTFQIFYDFSGYSDMAIGLGLMLGFHFPKNFDFPYISKTITEFWRRWHISLSSWFKEYVYIPLGGNRMGLPRQIINIVIVWALTGIWHGAGVNFLLWGLYYAVLLIIEKLFIYKKINKCPVINHIYTMFFVIIGWVIFAFTDISQLGFYLKSMFGFAGNSFFDSSVLFILRDNWFLFIVLILASIDFSFLHKGRFIYDENNLHKAKIDSVELYQIFVAFVLLLLSMAFLIGESYNPFLYFRF